MEQAQLELKTLKHLVQTQTARELLKRGQSRLVLRYFTAEASRKVATWIRDYTKLYKDVPNTADALLTYVNPQLNLLEEPLRSWCSQTITNIFHPTEFTETYEFCADQLEKNWLKSNATQNLDEAIKDLKADKYDTFIDKLHETVREVQPPHDSPTVNPIEDYPRILSQHQHKAANRELFKKIPSGIDLIDRSFGGGWSFGEYYLLMGYTGRGKSFCGTQFGYMGAWEGFNVTIANLEMSNLKAAHRMYARITGIPTVRFSEPWEMTAEGYQIWEQKMKEWQERKGKIQFLTFSHVPSVEDIMLQLDNLPTHTDLLIIDQITNMSTKLEWQELEVIAKKLEFHAKNWKRERGLAIVTFGQVKAETKWYETLTEQHFAYGKPVTEHATAVLYLAQKEEDYAAQYIKLGICKNRDNEPVTEKQTLYPNLSIARIHCMERQERILRGGDTRDIPF